MTTALGVISLAYAALKLYVLWGIDDDPLGLRWPAYLALGVFGAATALAWVLYGLAKRD